MVALKVIKYLKPIRNFISHSILQKICFLANLLAKIIIKINIDMNYATKIIEQYVN